MSGIINKVKDAIGGHHESKDHADHTAGPHNTDTANRVDPRVDSTTGNTGYGSSNPNYANTGATGTHGSSTLGGSEYGSGNTGTGYGSSTTGPHNSNIANKLDPRVDSDNSQYGSGTGQYGSGNTGTGYGTSTTGPHNSNVANKMDPRVDSENSQYGSSNTGTGYGSSNNGPHSSNLANKLDPRVDNSQNTSSGFSAGGYDDYTSGTTGGHHGTHGAQGSTMPGGAGSDIGPGYGSGTGYPPTSNTTGGNTGAYGSTGVTGEGHHGHHGQREHDFSRSGPPGSNLGHDVIGGSKHHDQYSSEGNRSIGERYADNATGGFRDGTGGTTESGYATTGGVGTHGTHGTHGQHTEYGDNEPENTKSKNHGPHSSSLLNKLDPRVDSDRDQSKTVGGNTESGRYDNKDTFDAAQVPPSQFGREAGHSFSTQGSKAGGGTI